MNEGVREGPSRFGIPICAFCFVVRLSIVGGPTADVKKDVPREMKEVLHESGPT